MAEPRAGGTFYGQVEGEEEEFEIAEVLEQDEGGNWKVVDDDGEEAVIKWSEANERWEVDA